MRGTNNWTAASSAVGALAGLSLMLGACAPASAPAAPTAAPAAAPTAAAPAAAPTTAAKPAAPTTAPAATAAAPAPTVASQAAASGKGMTIGISFDKLVTFREGERKFLELAAKDMGMTLKFANAQEDAQRQSSQVETFISQGVDGIASIPWEIQAVAKDIAAAKAAKIPFATFDQAPADLNSVVYHVGGDPSADGTAAGEFIVKAAAGKPFKVLEFQGGLNNDNGIRRSKSFDDALKAAPNITIVAQVPTEWKPEPALAGTENTLQTHPDLNGIYCPWDGCLEGVFSALDKAGKLKKVGEDGHIVIVSIDGDPTGCKAIRDKMDDMDLATPVPEMTKRVLQALVDAKKGNPPNKVEYLPGIPFTPANVDQMAPQVWGCSS